MQVDAPVAAAGHAAALLARAAAASHMLFRQVHAFTIREL